MVKRDILLFLFGLAIGGIILAIQKIADLSLSNRAELTKPHVWGPSAAIMATLICMVVMVLYVIRRIRELDKKSKLETIAKEKKRDADLLQALRERDTNLVQAFKQALEENNVKLAQTLRDVLGKGSE